ncbi:MAG TPA: LAGLIDADG family homing endonuclease [Candidatus Wunengus sp. YC60]|uniref:LAGLIDADG family homing endonuclease n=1 Tax=Candidatus Wunengus sp. YC60 TaxID=3367697 RepID=UPI004028EFD2
MQVDETHNYITADGTIHHNSGKSSACVFDIVRRANEQTPSPDGIRRSRWAVVRNSYGQLKDTTIKTFHDWFPPRLFGEYRVTDHSYLITKFPGVHLEVLFRALDRPDQVSNLLSLELTGAWFNEVREIPSAIITAMDGRINRYPSMRDGGPSWTGMIMDTNPPSDDSWLYKQFEVIRPDNWKIFKQPSGLSVHAENTKHLPKNYYINLAKGKDEMYKRIYIDGQYGYLVSGKPVFQSFRDNIHVAPHQLEPQKGLDVLVGFDFGLCYDDQTEVLTKAGWKFFKDVTDKDLVMTKNFETNVIEYQKPSKRIVREHDGDMYLYENNNLNFCVTAEHIVPCRKKCGRNGVDFKGNYRLTAEYLFNETSTNYSIDLLSKWNGNSRGLFGPLKWKANIFANFMGLYLSEGSCDRVHNRISIAQNKQDTLFQGILDDTGLDWKRGKKAWRCSNEKLNDYLKQFGYSSEKYIPDIIKNMASSDIERFIMTYTNGDGHIRLRENGSIEHTIFTISKRMADDFQELAQKVGWYAKIRIVKSQKSVIFENGKGREIHNEGGYSITFKKRAKQSRMIKKYFSKIKYYGKVYCLTVPNGTLYIRRKLTPSWNGNSPSVIIAQITPLGQLRILDELVSDGMGLRQFCENQLLPLLRLKYFGMNVMGFGDPSGTSRAPTDESTCFEVLQGPEVGLRNVVPAPTNAILPRVAAVENFLNRMYAGEPSFILSPNCHYLRKAMNGGYHYEKDPRSLGEEYKIMPAKNFSSHISDALEYLCMFIAEKDTHDKKWKELSSRVNLIGHTPVNSLGGY